MQKLDSYHLVLPLEEIAPSVAVPQVASRIHPDVAGQVAWMLCILQKQFDRLTTENPRPTLMTPVLPEHMEPLKEVQGVLRALEQAVTKQDIDLAQQLYRTAVTLTEPPEDHTINDPRTNYWQILSWYPAFKSLRQA